MSDDKYEGSVKDMMSDYNAARRLGITVEQYEGSARDRIADKAGECRLEGMKKSEDLMVKSDAPYKPGTPAFQNQPKVSSGFGQQRDGKLRCSGHSGAHRIGGRKK